MLTTPKSMGLALSLAALSAPIVAQGSLPGWRFNTVATRPYEFVDGSSGYLHLHLGTLTWEQINPEVENPATVRATLPLSIDAPGAITTAQQEDHFLVVGYDTTNSVGRLLHVELTNGTPRTLVVLHSLEFDAGTDPYRVQWSLPEGRLFVFDRMQKRLLSAQWALGGAFPTALTPILTRSQAPFLDTDLNRVHLVVPQAPGTGIDFVWVGLATYYHISQDAGVWSGVAMSPFSPTNAPPGYYVQTPYLANSTWPLILAGPVGPFSVVDVYTGQVVSTGSITTANQWMAFAPASGTMIPGHAHRIVGAGALESQPYLPLRRLGGAGASAGLRMTPGLIAYGKHGVGRADFTVATTVRLDNPPSGFSHSTDVHLWVAGVPTGAPDPVVTVNGNIVLQPQQVFGPVSITLSDSDPMRPIGVPAPIPQLTDLTDGMLYFQFAATAPNGTTVTSDVFAAQILAAAVAQQTAAGGTAPPTAAGGATATVTPTLQREAFRTWLGVNPNAANLAIYKTLIRALPRR